MKATRSDLKSIVKECLLEILSEGIGEQTIQEKIQRPSHKQLFTESSKRPQTSQVDRRPAPQLREAIRREAGGNKVMEAILADTASSTLPKMLQGDVKGLAAPTPGGLVEQVVASAAPEEIFGEDVASKWADLAFMGTSTKK